MDGASRPLIVKFADTKAQRRARGNGMSSRGLGSPGRGQSGHNPSSPYFIPPVPVYPNYQAQRAPPIGIPHQYSQYPPQYGQSSSQNFMYVPTGPYGYPSAPFNHNQMGNHSGGGSGAQQPGGAPS